MLTGWKFSLPKQLFLLCNVATKVFLHHLLIVKFIMLVTGFAIVFFEAANFVRFWMRLQFTYLQLHTWLPRIHHNVSVPVLYISTAFVSHFVIG